MKQELKEEIIEAIKEQMIESDWEYKDVLTFSFDSEVEDATVKVRFCLWYATKDEDRETNYWEVTYSGYVSKVWKLTESGWEEIKVGLYEIEIIDEVF